MTDKAPYISPNPERIKVDPDTGDVEIVAPDNWSDTNTWKTTGSFQFHLSEPSGWVCYGFGGTPEFSPFQWHPSENQVPNAFTRWMMKVCFACTWVKEKK